jgi:Winged helix DNA-binding domain
VPVRRLTWAEVCGRRLARHGLVGAGLADPAAVATAVAGVHAQVMSAAEVSIGLRVPGATRADVRRALWVDRTIVKTRGPRGTIHLLSTVDLPLWTGALSALPRQRSPFGADVRLTPEQTEAVLAAIRTVLAGAELTVDELTEAIVDTAGGWAGDLVMEAFQAKWPRWRQAEALATVRGAMCFGAPRGRQVTYTSPARWLPGFAPVSGADGLAWLARRYLTGYGPATAAQFARWLSVPVAWAAELLASLGDAVETVSVDGEAAWQVAGDVAGPAPSGLRLLPYFDAYAVGSYPRERVYPGTAGERALANGTQAGNFPVLLVDGVVAGVWHQRRSGRRVAITVEPLARLTRARLAALAAEVARVGEIVEATPTLTIGAVTVGGHA